MRREKQTVRERGSAQSEIEQHRMREKSRSEWPAHESGTVSGSEKRRSTQIMRERNATDRSDSNIESGADGSDHKRESDLRWSWNRSESCMATSCTI
jgi:hypothetical protein